MIKLKKVLKDKRVTQDKLAKKLGVSRQTINNWVNGKNYPRAVELQKLANFLNIDIQEIFFK